MKTIDKIEGTYAAVVRILDNYLEMNNHRKTPERYAILNAVYSTNGHFSLDELNEKYNLDIKKCSDMNNVVEVAGVKMGTDCTGTL